MKSAFSDRKVTRRELLTGGAALLISGCTLPVAITNAANATRFAVVGAPDIPIPSEYASSLPYASISAKIGRGPRSMLVLGRYAGSDLHWISADRVAVATRNGRVVKTAGLGRNLRDTHGLDDDPVAAATFEFEGIHMRSVDLHLDQNTFGVPIDSIFTVQGRETITILERQFDTMVVSEVNKARTMRWRFKNQYWFDFQTGFMWKSIQTYSPGATPLEIEVLKRAL